MAKKKLKVGIVGVGNIGTCHANTLAAVGQTELVAICDINAPRLKEKGDLWGVSKRFEDYHDLVAQDLDAVFVCVWNAHHRDIAVAASKAGKHVFCEKPMAMSARQGRQMVDAAKAARRVLQIGMVWRQHPAALVAREMVENGDLGDIYHVRAVFIRRRGIPGLGGWFTTKALSGGGPLIDCGVHWLDVSMHLAGLWKPTSVSAKTYAKFGPRMREYHYVGMWAGPPDYHGVFDVEDYSTGLVRFGAKATMVFEVAWAANSPGESFVEILGDKGGLRVLDGRGVTLFTEYGKRIVDINPQYDGSVDYFHTQARKFIAACRGEGRPPATGEQGVTVMKVIDAIYASSRAGKEVAIQ